MVVVAVAVAKTWRRLWLETGRGLKVKVFQEEHTYCPSRGAFKEECLRNNGGIAVLPP